MSYRPFHELGELEGITLAVMRLPAGRAWWMPDVDGVVLDDRLDRVGRRCALAHELEHIRRGDRHIVGTANDPWFRRRAERHADTAAARRLIPLPVMIDALRWTNDDRELAEILDVDLDTLRCRSADLTSDECAAIEAALDDEWRSA